MGRGVWITLAMLVRHLHMKGPSQVHIWVYCGCDETKEQKRSFRKTTFSAVLKLHSQLDHSMNLFSLPLNYKPEGLGTVLELPSLPESWRGQCCQQLWAFTSNNINRHLVFVFKVIGIEWFSGWYRRSCLHECSLGGNNLISNHRGRKSL